MSLLTIPNTFTVGAIIVASQHNSNFSTIYNDYNGGIVDANISPSAGITDTKLGLISSAGKVSGSSFVTLGSIPSGAGTVPTVNIGSGTANSATVLLGNSSWGQNPYVKCTNTQSQNVGGGSSTAGSWQTQPLNTKDNDTASIATLSSNTIALPAGTYQVKASGLFTFGNGTSIFGWAQLRLYNNTGSAVLITGQNGFFNGTNLANMIAATSATLAGQFTIGSSSTVALNYQVSTGAATIGLGQPFNFGPEVYAMIEFWKVG